MKSFFILAMTVLHIGYGQPPITEQLQLIEISEHLNNPFDLIGELQSLDSQDHLALITFSRTTGKLLEYC
ncbi:MAG: hypothetical protein AAF969_00900, partial [Bacteroidota bacterium]